MRRAALAALLAGLPLPPLAAQSGSGAAVASLGPGALERVSLGKAPFNGLKARVTGISFFESGATIPEQKLRTVTRTFDALTTRFINLELELEYPRAAKRTAFEVQCRFDGPDGRERTPVLKGTVEAGWVGSYHTAGWGSLDRGKWPEGKYTVTCREEGVVVASAGFDVVKTTAAVRTLGAQVTHLRFFQSLDEKLPVEPRQYSTRFDGRTARWIKAEFGLVYPQASSPLPFLVECAFVFPDSSVKYARVERQIPAGWTGSVHAQGVGWPEAGHWPLGKYKVSCWNNGERMKEAGFEVFDAAAAVPATSGGRLRFFGRKQGDPAGPPQYGTSFDIGTLDTLYAEAQVPLRAAGDSAAFGCYVTDPAGATAAFAVEGEVRESEKAIVATGPVGGGEAPRLRGGYRVECRTGAKAVTLARFVVNGPADIAALDARILATGLYEGGEDPPGDEAVGDVVFSAPKVRSLWLVLLLDHPSDQGAGRFAYSCRITGARNVVYADTGPRALEVLAGDRAFALRQRFVLAPRLKWTPGKYTLTCSSGGSAFLKLPFDLTR